MQGGGGELAGEVLVGLELPMRNQQDKVKGRGMARGRQFASI
jgi:hypothetical protein